MILTTLDLDGGKLYRQYDPNRDEYKLSFRIPGNRIFLGWISSKTVNKYSDIFEEYEFPGIPLDDFRDWTILIEEDGEEIYPGNAHAIYQQRMIQRELQEIDRKHPPAHTRGREQKAKSPFIRDDFTR